MRNPACVSLLLLQFQIDPVVKSADSLKSLAFVGRNVVSPPILCFAFPGSLLQARGGIGGLDCSGRLPLTAGYDASLDILVKSNRMRSGLMN